MDVDEYLKRELDTHMKMINSHDEQLNQVRETLAALKEIERQNQERIDSAEKELKELKNKPAQRWDYAITAGIAAIISYAVTTLVGVL